MVLFLRRRFRNKERRGEMERRWSRGKGEEQLQIAPRRGKRG